MVVKCTLDYSMSKDQDLITAHPLFEDSIMDNNGMMDDIHLESDEECDFAYEINTESIGMCMG